MSILNKIYIYVSIILPALLSLFLQFLPLTNTTGFEFSFILTIPLFISGGLIAIVNPSKRIKKYSIVSVTIIPFVISLTSNLFFSVCPIGTDLLFYPVLSIPAFIIGYLWGVFIHNNMPIVRLGYLLISLQILLLFSLAEFYFLPQIYFYNPVFGYFPGTIYDHHISLTWGLVFYRLLTIVFFYLFSKMRCSLKEHNYKPLISIPIILIAWFILIKPWLGYSTTEGRIESELNLELKTEHFQIFTDKDIQYDTTSLKDLHEFYYKEIKEKLKLNDDVSIKSYIFKSKQQKKELFGSENADVAKPWLKQIYLDERNFTNSLKHELVHIMAGEFGNSPFDVAAYINPSLIEGMAMAIEDNYDDKEIDYIVSLAVKSGDKTDLSELFSGLNFFGNASSKSYLFAGSFIKYLINTYGIEKVKEVYKDADFLKSYDKPIDVLEDEYNGYITSLDYKINKETANLYFGYQPLVRKICPRVAARMEKEAWELFRKKAYEDAKEKFEFIFKYSGSYSSLNGILLSDIQLNNYTNALELAEENIQKFENTSYLYNLELRIADISILNSDSLRAEEIISDLLEQNPSVSYYNAAVLRELLLEKGVEYYSDFLLSIYQKKILLIKDFVEIENNNSVVPEIIDFSKNLSEEHEVIKNVVNNYSPSVSREGIYAAYKLSEYFFSKGVLTIAEEYADFAYQNNSMPELQNIINENYELINWSLSQ